MVESVKAPFEPRTFAEVEGECAERMPVRLGITCAVKFNSAFSFPQRCEVGAGRVNRFTPRGSPILAFSFPQLRQLRASGYGRLHVLNRNPFERTMRVVLTAKQIWGWKAELGQA